MIMPTLKDSGALFAHVSARTYAFAPVTSPAEYITRFLGLAKNVAYVVSGGLPPNSAATWLTAATMTLLTTFGLVLAWQRGNRLLLYVFVSTLVLLPILVLPAVLRYFVFLAPLAYVAVGLAVEHIVGRVHSCAHTLLSRIDIPRDVADRPGPAWVIVAESPGADRVAGQDWQVVTSASVPAEPLRATLSVYRVPGRDEAANQRP